MVSDASGLARVPATLQYINQTLREYLDHVVHAFIDDVLIYQIYPNGSPDNHQDKVRRVLGKLQDAGLYVDIDKCAFKLKEVI